MNSPKQNSRGRRDYVADERLAQGKGPDDNGRALDRILTAQRASFGQLTNHGVAPSDETARFSANLSHLGSFNDFMGLICQLKASGVVVITLDDEQYWMHLDKGLIGSWGGYTSDTQYLASQHELDEVMQELFWSLQTPQVGFISWHSSIHDYDSSRQIDYPIEYIFLEALRRFDESGQSRSAKLLSLPQTARIVPSLCLDPMDERLVKVRSALGAPPYSVRRLNSTTIEPSIIELVEELVHKDLLIVEREDEITMPPTSGPIDSSRSELQSLVARFNHIFRRLIYQCAWTPSDFQTQLSVFTQYYGYQDYFRDVRQLDDGAIEPLTLIENAMLLAKTNLTQRNQVAEALQELLIFEISAAKELDSSAKRTLMAMAAQITNSLTPEGVDVA